MKKIFSIILFLSVVFCGFALTKMQIYINGDNGAWSEPVEGIDSIKYAIDTIKVDDDVEGKKYAIYFSGPNGEIKTDSLAFGEMPECHPSDCFTKYGYTYYFKHWSPAITKVRGNASYYAVYESIGRNEERIYLDYKDSIISIVFPDNGYNYEHTAPQNVPTKPNNFHYKYTFKEWKGSETYGDKWEGTTYTEDGIKTGTYEIYKEVLDSTPIQYDIILKYDGQSATVKRFFDYKPTPTVFSSTLHDWVNVTWTQNLSLVEHDTIIFTASYKDVAKQDEGTLPAPFHINDSTIIYFSKGNLQYNAGDGNTHKTADSTAQGTWRFAERQYDYVGEENVGKDSTYNGWVDLFEWGSSGWKGTHDHDYVSLDTAQCRNADWGVYNAISNGGDEPGLWRVLSYEEWAYLLNRSNWAFAKVGKDSTQCLVIFPSNFVAPDTMNIVYASTSDKNDFDESYEYAYKGGPGINKSNTNIFSDEEFEKLEARGAVALPCAGLVDGDEGRQFNWYGNIWTSTHEGATKAIEIYFGSTFAGGSVYTDVKKSVRLVHEVE